MSEYLGFEPTDQPFYYFISYNHEDAGRVGVLAKQLNDLGVPFWYDYGLEVSDPWDPQLADKISNSQAVVLFFTKGILDKEESFVQTEYEIAKFYDKRIYTLIMDPITKTDVPKNKVSWWVMINRSHNLYAPDAASLSKLTDHILRRSRPSAVSKPGEAGMPADIRHNGERWLVSSPVPLVKPYFCGRDEYIRNIESYLSQGERVVFLYGIGGIGKTEIAKQYAKTHRDQYDTVIFAVYETDLQDLIIKDQPFELYPPVPRMENNGIPEDDSSYYRRKMDVIRRSADEKTLIILDNFNVDHDPCLSDLAGGRYHLLVTTQFDYSRQYRSMKVAEIGDMDSLVSIFMNHYQGFETDQDDPDLRKLIELVNRHTYTVVLLAHHMENSGQSPGEMIRELREHGIASLNEDVNLDGDNRDTAYNNLVRMFSVFRFREEEQRIIQLLSLIPLSGVPVKLFKKWADLSSLRILSDLEKKCWILRSSDTITLHPVIRRVVQFILPVRSHEIQGFLERLIDVPRGPWFLTKREKEQYAAIVKSIDEQIGTIDEATIGFYEFASFVLSVSHEPEYAIELDKKVFAYYCETKGEYSRKAAYTAGRISWDYLYNLQMENALENGVEWGKRSVGIYERIGEKYKQCAVLENLSKAYLTRYKRERDERSLAEAKKYAQQAVDLAKRVLADPDAKKTGVIGSLIQQAEICMMEKEYDRADELLDKSLRFLIKPGTDTVYRDPDTLRVTSRQAKLLYYSGDYRRSLEETEENILGYQKYGMIDTPSYFDQLVLKVKNCIQLNDLETAKRTQEEALEAGKKLYPENSTRIQELKSLI